MGSQSIVDRKQASLQIYPSLVPSGSSITANLSERFVLLDECSWPKMKRYALEFCTMLDQQLTEFFLSPGHNVALNAALARVEKYGSDDVKRNLLAPYLLRIKGYRIWKNGRRAPYFAFVSYDQVCDAIERTRQAMGANLPVFHGMEVLDQPYKVQRAVANHLLFANPVRDMQWAKVDWCFPNVASASLRNLISTSSSALELLDQVCEKILDWFADEIDARKRGDPSSAEDSKGRPFALAWFAIWLAERGIILFPLSYGRCCSDLIPRFWRHFRHVFLPEGTQKSWQEMELQIARLGHQKCFDDSGPVGAKGGDAVEKSRSATSFLRLVSTWRGSDQVSADFLRDLFPHVSASMKYFMLIIWDGSKAKCRNNSSIDLRDEEAKLRLRKARPRSGPREGRVWPWVDTDCDYQPRPGEKHYIKGFKAGPNMLRHVEELRDLLPRIVGKSVATWTASLSVWLRYLATLPDSAVPPRLLDIDRTKHIDAPNDPGRNTLCKFEREYELSKTLRPRVYYHLEAAWNAAYDLAPAERRPAAKICPVLVRFDAPRTLNSQRAQTHRRPLDEEILHFVIAENRKNDFAFSRERRHGKRGLIDYRRVTDTITGEAKYEWFPGFAVLMDVLLNIPLRKKQGRYLDSGEGDELSLNIETLELSTNLRATAVHGRQSAFLCRRSISIVEDKPVLGMFVNTNKTGTKYTVPWLPMDVARNVQFTIDWQERFNPINRPVPDRDYNPSNRGGTDIFDEPVWPIFRDPGDPSNEPIADGKLQTYFAALLEHCEEEFNKNTGRNISLFMQEETAEGKVIEKPVIDLHSLRVTGVTVLIENGVPLEIVRQLVGHASIAMTCYYHVIESRQVHEELMRALEKRSVTVERLQKMSPEEFNAFSDRFAFNRSGEPRLAMDMVSVALKNRNPGWDLKYHGLCAGGDCRFGGAPGKDGEPRALWRFEACSLCRYRVTGAPWLVGLVHHLNELWFELRECSKNVLELQLRRDAAEDEGRSTRSISGDLERTRIRRDHLLDEWANELGYVEQAKQDLDEWVRWCDARDHQAQSPDEAALISLRSPMDETGIQVQLARVHQLSHLTELIRGARILSSAILPRGVQEDRNALLLEIARVSQEELPFLKLLKRDAMRALDLFADVVLDQVSDPDELEDLVCGRTSLSKYPEIQGRVLALLSSEADAFALGQPKVQRRVGGE